MNERVEDLSLERLLDEVGARTTAPGGGSVAEVLAALAGALAGMCARFSDGDQGDLGRRADGLTVMSVQAAEREVLSRFAVLQ